MKKGILSIVAVLALSALLFTGCSAPAAQNKQEQEDETQVYTIKIGSAVAVEHPQNMAAKKIQELLKERSGGRLIAEWYPAEQLGNENTMLENVQVGLQDAMIGSSEIYANYCPDFNILGMAFAFESAEHVQKFFKSDTFKVSLDKLSNEFGIHIVSLGFQKNPRAIFGKKPILVPEDLEGVKFRVPNIPIWEKNFRQLGAVPTIVAWSEYPFALLQGVVDAGEATYESIYSMKLHEAAPYISLLAYAYPVEAFAMSQKTWEKLPEDLQQILQEVVDETALWYSEQIKASWLSDKEKISAEGGQFFEPDKEPWIEKMAPLADKLEAEGYWDTPDLYQIVQDMR